MTNLAVESRHTVPKPGYTRADFSSSPFVVFYETTQACDLVCEHCRACAQLERNPKELSTETACCLFEQLGAFDKPPLLVLTGGDPIKRPDIFDLIAHATRVGLPVAMTPSATPLVTRQAIVAARDAGLTRLAVSLDGADATTHDGFRGVAGSYRRTLQIVRDAGEEGLPVQVNTTISQRNVEQVDAMAELLATLDIVLWSVFFLVPVGRGSGVGRISPEQYEDVFARLWHHAQNRPYGVKTTEAPHYRRFLLQQGQGAQGDRSGRRGRHNLRAPMGVNDGKGVMFVSHTGVIFPSGFLPVPCGVFPEQSVVTVYRQSPVFQSLRDPAQLKGKCGDCRYRTICGGSRARAFALTGDLLAEEPDCVYQPQAKSQTT